jgi:hypothetical protein
LKRPQRFKSPSRSIIKSTLIWPRCPIPAPGTPRSAGRPGSFSPAAAPTARFCSRTIASKLLGSREIAGIRTGITDLAEPGGRGPVIGTALLHINPDIVAMTSDPVCDNVVLLNAFVLRQAKPKKYHFLRKLPDAWLRISPAFGIGGYRRHKEPFAFFNNA